MTELDPPTQPAQVAEVVITFICPCGSLDAYQVACQEDMAGTWSASLEDRYILCETCGTLMDMGLQVTVGAPHA